VSFSAAWKLVTSIFYKLPNIRVCYYGKNLLPQSISRYSSQFEVESHNLLMQ